MKKLFITASATLVLFSLTSCEEDAEPFELGGHLEIDGTIQEMHFAYYHLSEPNEHGFYENDIVISSLELDLENERIPDGAAIITVSLLNDESSLIDGSYSYEQTGDKPFTFSDGFVDDYIEIDGDEAVEPYYLFSNGSFTLESIDLNHRLSFDLTTDEGKTVTGSFYGSLTRIIL